MPFKSKAQRRFMYAKHPEIAKRWSKEYPDQKGLPEKKKKKAGDPSRNDRFSFGKEG